MIARLLGDQDKYYEPIGKTFVVRLIQTLWGVLIALALGDKLSRWILLIGVAFVVMYFAYLFLTKQTYIHHLNRKTKVNEKLVEQFKK